MSTKETPSQSKSPRYNITPRRICVSNVLPPMWQTLHPWFMATLLFKMSWRAMLGQDLGLRVQWIMVFMATPLATTREECRELVKWALLPQDLLMACHKSQCVSQNQRLTIYLCRLCELQQRKSVWKVLRRTGSRITFHRQHAHNVLLLPIHQARFDIED